jgi:NACHT domain
MIFQTGSFLKKNINIKSIDWAKDVPRIITGEGPQNLIDKYLEGQDYDIYIGILWKRFGEPHPNGLAPTEGEFEDAFRRYKKTGKPLITFFFKEEKFYPHDEYEISQFSSVLKFKKKIKPLGLYDSFTRESEFIEKAFVCVQDFVEKLTTTKDSQISFERIKFPEVKDYIPRKIYPANEYKPDEFWIIGDELKKDIINIVKLKNRIALIGDAGAGKTFELQRIANHFSEENSPFYPLLIRLNTFTNQSIEQILPENWREIPENQLLIIFDGLDEIESKNKKDTVRKIEYFSEQHQATSIIISCRTNFYQTEDSQSSGTLKGFDTYRLLDLESVQINYYVRLKLSSKANRFFNEIYKQQIGQLLNIPFYLVKVVELFEIKNALPNRKAAIFEQLFLARIKLDEEHFRTTLELDEYRDTIIKNLERIALGMETLGQNYISDDEFREIVPDVPLREMFKYCTAWKKTEGETIIWQFEHNSIQEYLAARVLSRQHINVIKNFVSFKPEYKKIIPSWVNAVSFLLSVSDDSSLLDWILEVEPEICLKFEPDKIKKTQRIKIFKDIFNRYKEKQIWIDRDKFRYDELARLSHFKKNIPIFNGL